MFRIGIDVGGTFTDLVAVDGEGRVTIAKVPSTPANLAAGAPPFLPAGNVAEKTFGLWARYKFTEGLKGLAIGGGVSYQDKKAITDSGNTTFFGYVPGRTLADYLRQVEEDLAAWRERKRADCLQSSP